MHIFQRDATKAQCRRLWISFGFGTIFLNYLFYGEQIRLQALNKYTYNIFVARVKTRIRLPTPALLSLWFNYQGSALIDAIVSFSHPGSATSALIDSGNCDVKLIKEAITATTDSSESVLE